MMVARLISVFHLLSMTTLVILLIQIAPSNGSLLRHMGSCGNLERCFSMNSTTNISSSETRRGAQRLPSRNENRRITTDNNDGNFDVTNGTEISSDPSTLKVKNGCVPTQDDPDTIRNVSEIIRSRGFEAEEYDLKTRDGYILTIQRVVNPLVKKDYRRRLKPIILQHGLMSSSFDWVINSFGSKPVVFPPNEVGNSSTNTSSEIKTDTFANKTEGWSNSLAFFLANRGYDVFLSNSRGNIYGQRHRNFTTGESRFWDFCFDEKIEHDLPETIQFVRRKTNHYKVAYVGHSQGSAMMFGLLSERPEFIDLIEPFIAFAPVAYVNNAITPLRRLDFLTPLLQNWNKAFRMNEALITFLASQVCHEQVIQKRLCANFLFLMVGFSEEEFDSSRIPAYLCHVPAGTSLKNLAHYGQEIRSGRFAKFDRGLLGNLRKYGRYHPPDYDLSRVRHPSMIFFTAENDWLASPQDVAHLISSLGTKPIKIFNLTESNPNWNHIDFIYGKRAGQLINTRVYDLLEQFPNPV